MATYRIEWKSSALKDIKHLDRSIIPRIIAAIESLSEISRPSGVRKLQGSDQSYRIRVGEYRVVYEIIDKIVCIVIIRIGHRKEIYRN
jgi:mRNA interferase RelE/StbE